MTRSDSYRNRWLTPPGAALAAEVVARLASSRSLAGLDLDTVDGRVDLRGLVAPTGAVDRLRLGVELRGATLRTLDLSAAELPHLRLFNCSVVECRFDRAACEDMRIWGTTVTRCTFRGARLPKIILGSGSQHGPPNVWESIDFSNAAMRGAVAREAIFRHCDFSAAKIDKVEFRQCEFLDCRFSGKMRDVIFDGRATIDAAAPGPMRRVDFAEAALDLCDFKGYEFLDVVPPRDPEVHVVTRFRDRARSALDAVADDSSLVAGDLRAVLNHALRGPDIGAEAVYVLNERDLRGYPSGEELVRLARRLLGPEDPRE